VQTHGSSFPVIGVDILFVERYSSNILCKIYKRTSGFSAFILLTCRPVRLRIPR